MCGIAGTTLSNADFELVKQFQLHRGPDEQAFFKDASVSLFHWRLAILDLSGGKQPMQLDDRYYLVWNGEIYNHNDLRRKYNLECKTSSDTETILYAFKKCGFEFLKDCDGMFAIALYDKAEKKLFFARDRAGKKPLYMSNHNGELSFASELNTLKNITPKLEVDTQAIQDYLFLGFNYKSKTPYKHVIDFPAGTQASYDLETRTLKMHKWWAIDTFYKRSKVKDEREVLQKVDEYLHKGIQRRLESSDLEVGSFLSGGIDSGLVTAIAAGYKDKLKTFTVSFDGAYDESVLAKEVAEKYKTEHTQINISYTNLNEDIQNIIYNYGEPYFDSSAIPSYYVSQEAKKHITVVLNGDGADELFAGYRRYVPYAKTDFFNEKSLVKNALSSIYKVLPSSNDKKSRYNYVFRLAALAAKKNLDVYLSTTLDIINEYEEKLKFDPNYALKELRSDFEEINASGLSGLDKLMLMDFNTILFGDLLVKMDIATMANSLEGRSPFLCKEILEYSPTIDKSLKIRNSQTKYLLRKLATKYLPKNLLNQPKRGFEIPLKNWVNGILKDQITDVLSKSKTLYEDYIEKDFIYSLLNNKENIPAEKRAKLIWTVFCLEVWHDKK